MTEPRMPAPGERPPELVGRYTIVFTGTQAGMTEAQKRTVASLFSVGERLYHGCCVGADGEANNLWVDFWNERLTVFGYPSNVPGKRSPCLTGLNQMPAPPLERNKTMVDDAVEAGNPLCLAAPKGMQEELRSGTWATVRYARKRGVPIGIAWPDGTLTIERGRRATPGAPPKGEPKNGEPEND